jgi:hypothetical protein
MGALENGDGYAASGVVVDLIDPMAAHDLARRRNDLSPVQSWRDRDAPVANSLNLKIVGGVHACRENGCLSGHAFSATYFPTFAI